MPIKPTNDYPKNWQGIAAGVRVLADHRCVRCGHPDPPESDYPRGLAPCGPFCMTNHVANDLRKYERQRKRVLTVHHLNGDKSMNVWWNLLALCQICHLQIQAKVVPANPYMWEHKAWFKPYAAGFYAHQNQRNVSREHVLANLDTYLALGQPHLYEDR